MLAAHESIQTENQHSLMAKTTPADFNPLALLPIFEESQQVWMVPRPSNVQISHYLVQMTNQLTPGFRVTLNASDPILAQLETQARLPDTPGKQALLADMVQLTTVYADLLDCPRIGLRLEVLTHAMCPRFHIDRTGIRLVCTYLGAGSEWLDDRYTNRLAMDTQYATIENFHENLILHPGAIVKAPPSAIVLLKGSLWQGNSQGGIIHRSPNVPPGKYRVLLALDAIW